VRTFLIGLDGATFSVLDPFMDKGIMPNLRELMRRGCRGELLSTALHLTPPAWTSLITGRTPGAHGIFDFFRPIRNGAGIYIRPVTSRDIRTETIWSYVSRLGRRVISLNFPVMFPPPAVSGYLISGLISSRHLRRAVYPSTLMDRLTALPDFDAKALGWDMDEEEKCIRDLPQDEYEAWIRFHIRRERQWFAIFVDLLRTEPADLCAVLFDGVDKLQHLCWHLIDPALASSVNSVWERGIHELCLDYFRQLDGFIGDIVSLAGRDATLVVVSDHGFGPTEMLFHVNVWLQQHGYLEWAVASSDGAAAQALSRRDVRLFDWSRTRAYAVTASSNGIHIAISDDPEEGGVAPAEYESFRSTLIKELLDAIDPETGQLLIRRVMTREEAFPGPHCAEAPDLTLVLQDYGFVSVANGPSSVTRRPAPKGMHRPEGIMAAVGPSIVQGAEINQLSIVDICPALLYSMDLPVPRDLEGRFPTEIFEPAVLRDRPPRYGEPTIPPGEMQDRNSEPCVSPDENAAIIAGLGALGYADGG
jgi:predicted AlkP superfamily phosphohydrolase/phosphomutase